MDTSIVDTEWTTDTGASNHMNCEFTNDLFSFKEGATGRILLVVQCKGDLYVLPKMKEANFSTRQNSGTDELWNQRLGHPQSSAFKILHTKKLIDVNPNKKVDTVCEGCQLGILSKLPFNSSTSLGTKIF